MFSNSSSFIFLIFLSIGQAETAPAGCLKPCFVWDRGYEWIWILGEILGLWTVLDSKEQSTDVTTQVGLPSGAEHAEPDLPSVEYLGPTADVVSQQCISNFSVMQKYSECFQVKGTSWSWSPICVPGRLDLHQLLASSKLNFMVRIAMFAVTDANWSTVQCLYMYRVSRIDRYWCRHAFSSLILFGVRQQRLTES